MNPSLAHIEREALALPAAERARLADKLWESVLDRSGLEVVMTPNLEEMLEEGLRDLDQSKPSSELRR